MDKRKTGELIKNARIDKNYTQSELGALIGVSNKAVSRWETGDSFPDAADSFYQISLCLCCAFLCAKSYFSKGAIFELGSKWIRYGCLFLIFLMACAVVLLATALHMIEQGKGLLGMELYQLGPFLYHIFAGIGWIGFGFALFYLYRRYKQQEETIGGVILAVAAVHLCSFYCDFLFRVESIEGAYQVVRSDTVFVVVITLIGIVLSILICKKGETVS